MYFHESPFPEHMHLPLMVDGCRLKSWNFKTTCSPTVQSPFSFLRVSPSTRRTSPPAHAILVSFKNTTSHTSHLDKLHYKQPCIYSGQLIMGWTYESHFRSPSSIIVSRSFACRSM